MNAMNRRPLFGRTSSGNSWRGSLSAALAVALGLAVAACGSPNAGDDETGSDTTVDGIGTSPSDPNPDPPPPDPTPTPGLGKRVASANDPTGCPAGMTIILGTAGADVLESSDASTCFVGLGGDDVIFARGAGAVVIAGERAYVAAQPDAIVRGTTDVVRLAR